MADRVPTGEVTEAALASFTDWFVKNYPGPDTIIHKPEWHAPKIFRAVDAAMRKVATPEQDGLVERQLERLKAVANVLANGAQRADDDECHPLYPHAVAARQILGNHIESQAAQIAELRRERDEAQRRDERVREAMFVLSDRLNLIGALDSDNVHAAYEKVVAALTNNGGENA